MEDIGLLSPKEYVFLKNPNSVVGKERSIHEKRVREKLEKSVKTLSVVSKYLEHHSSYIHEAIEHSSIFSILRNILDKELSDKEPGSLERITLATTVAKAGITYLSYTTSKLYYANVSKQLDNILKEIEEIQERYAEHLAEKEELQILRKKVSIELPNLPRGPQSWYIQCKRCYGYGSSTTSKEDAFINIRHRQLCDVKGKGKDEQIIDRYYYIYEPKPPAP